MTALVNVPSSVVIGLGSDALCVVNVQPGFCWTSTFAKGKLVGNWTSRRTVDAIGDSVGTRNANTSVAPFGSEDGSISTWAHAGLATTTTAPTTVTQTTNHRHARLLIDSLS